MQFHQSDPRILDQRCLKNDHRRLAEILQSGMSVLDVGCGTGAITADIACAVGERGFVLGINRDLSLLDIARSRCNGIANLSFAEADALTFHPEIAFDVVTASRALQWIAEPGKAVQDLKRAVRPGGLLVILDYSHSRHSWQPAPPEQFQRFFQAFLRWRESHGWDNDMAFHLAALFEEAALIEVLASEQDETFERGQPEFAHALGTWSKVIESIGPALIKEGVLATGDVEAAAAAYDAWCDSSAQRQHLVLRTVEGRVSS